MSTSAGHWSGHSSLVMRLRPMGSGSSSASLPKTFIAIRVTKSSSWSSSLASPALTRTVGRRAVGATRLERRARGETTEPGEVAEATTDMAIRGEGVTMAQDRAPTHKKTSR